MVCVCVTRLAMVCVSQDLLWCLCHKTRYGVCVTRLAMVCVCVTRLAMVFVSHDLLWCVCHMTSYGVRVSHDLLWCPLPGGKMQRPVGVHGYSELMSGDNSNSPVHSLYSSTE